MKKQITTFLQKPKSVTIISLLIALGIGYAGYHEINKTTEYKYEEDNSIMSPSKNSAVSQNISLGFLSGGRIKSINVKAGDKVKKGEILATLDAENASGVLTQARATYANAKAKYQKVINGATGTTVDVARATLHTAEVNLNESTKQQGVLVTNAKRNLLNSTVTAIPTNDTNPGIAPTITGSYNKDIEGTMTITPYQTGDGGYFNLSGITTGIGKIRNIPEPLGDSGLSIQFPTNVNYNGTWTITIPNTTAQNYLSNWNTYQTALQTQSQVIANASAVVEQAQANLASAVAVARPEDIAVSQAEVDSAYGAMQIAESVFNNTIIKAPQDGTITAVSVAVGQIAIPNAVAIEILTNNTLSSN